MMRFVTFAFAALASTAAMGHGFQLPQPTRNPDFGTRGRTDGPQPVRNDGGDRTPGLPGPGGRPTGAVASARGGNTPAGRSRPAVSAPWIKDLRVNWTPEFVPSVKSEGYGFVAGTISDALRLPRTEGGFVLDGRAVLVASYDAMNEGHVRALRALDQDGRIRTASRFFQCFRADAATARSDELRLSVFDASGRLVGEAAYEAGHARVFALLSEAYARDGRGDLGADCDRLDPLLKHEAYCRYLIRTSAAAVVCPDCGERRADAEAATAEAAVELAEADRKIRALTGAKH